MIDFHASATELLCQLTDGTVRAVDAAQFYLDRIAALDGRTKAFLTVSAERSLARAAEIDARRAAGRPVGPLGGLPVAIKDILCTQGWRTTCGSRMLEHYVPPYDATVVRRLEQADAVLIGKTNLDEFAMGGSTENSAFHPTTNPWDEARTPGGSSGGSAACVAAGLAPVAIGTDTGGSIRQPAAFCGIVGLKPTYGRVSRYGVVAYASSLDQVGPMGRTVEDVALLLDVIAGHDPADATSADVPVEPCLPVIDQPLTGLRLGIVREHFGAGLQDDVRRAVEAAIDVYRSLGATTVDVPLPHARYAVATYYIIAPCEASSNLARYEGVHYGFRADEAAVAKELDEERRRLRAAGETKQADDLESVLVRLYRQTRSTGFGAEVKRRVMLGTYALSAGYYDAYYLKAQQVRRLIRQDFDQAFQTVDLIVGPTTPQAAFRLGELVDNPLAMYLEDLYTVSANLAGIAGLSVPGGFTANGLPVGLQLLAPPFGESRLLRAARMFQRATDWHRRWPPLANESPSADKSATDKSACE